jgi:hypothetical protein
MEKWFGEFCQKKGKNRPKKRQKRQIHVSKSHFKNGFRNIKFFFTGHFHLVMGVPFGVFSFLTTAPPAALFLS